MTELAVDRSHRSALRNPDTFVKAEIGELETLDPAFPYDTRSWEIMANVYETLFVYSRTRKRCLPRLAARVPTRDNGLISEDGRTYVIPLRPGIAFHGGEPLTPDDVAYSLRRLVLHHHPGGPAWMLVEPLLGVSRLRDEAGSFTVDPAEVAAAIRPADDSVVLELRQPFAPLPAILTTPPTSIVSRNWAAANGEWSGEPLDADGAFPNTYENSFLHTQMNGTGPYRFVGWRPDIDVELVRNDAYWGRRPPLRRAVVLKENDWGRRRELILSGEADMVQTDRTFIPEIAETPGITVYDDLPLDVCDAISFNLDIDVSDNPFAGSGRLDGDGVPPDFFADPHVRRGFQYAFDWDRVIDEVHLRKAVRLRGPIPSGVVGHDPEAPVYYFDLGRAERELRRAFGGRLWEVGFRCTALYNEGNSLREGWLRILRDGLAGIAERFRIEVAAVDLADHRRYLEKRALPLYTIGWLVDYPDAHNFVQPIMSSSGAWARFQSYRNPEVDDLVHRAVFGVDEAQRRDLYRRVQELAYEDAKEIYTVEPLGLAVLRSWVRGWDYDLITGPQAITFFADLEKVDEG